MTPNDARTWRRLCATGALWLTLALGAARLTAQEVTTRVCVSSAGKQGNRESQVGSARSMSADGRYVTFISYATNLVSGDTNNAPDVFVRDRLTGETTRASVNSSGTEGNYFSVGSTISDDGRYVAFGSAATNLVPGDTNDIDDVFVHDNVLGETTRVSVDSSGNQANDGSGGASISADGRYVAFLSYASNLVAGDTNGLADIFVHDRLTGETTRVSVDSQRNQGNGDSTFYGPPSISDDGRYVAFDSDASNLVPGDTNNVRDVFIHDRLNGQTKRVSVDSSGNQASDASAMASISADGRYVAFTSWARNLVPFQKEWPPHTNIMQVFVHDLMTGQTEIVSKSSAGLPGDSGSDYSSISGDGRLVAFYSAARNFDHKSDVDWPLGGDVYVHDRSTGDTTLVSVNSAGFAGNTASWDPSISSDGRYVTFESYATNLVSGDTNRKDDVFVNGIEISLEADPSSVPVGQTLTLTEYKGLPGTSASLWAVSVDGIPIFDLVATGSFAGDGNFIISGIVPSSLSGSVIIFRGYALGTLNVVVETNDVAVSFH